MKPVKKGKKEKRKTIPEQDSISENAANKPLVKISSGIRARIVNEKSLYPKPVPVPPKAGVRSVDAAATKLVPKPVPKPQGGEPEFEVKKTKIRIIGIGGGGGNIVSEIAGRVKRSTFCIANTDFAALRNAPKTVTVFQFGENMTHGLGTGMDPHVAEEAALAEREQIKKMMEDQDLVIIVASLGGGTGSGAAPIFAQISKGLGNLTYGIFTLPFVFEGAKKNDIAKNSLERLRPYLNAMTVLPNERVFEVVPKSTPFSKTLSYINTMLSDSLEGLIETIYDTGLINIDFADLRAILAGNGKMAFLNTVSFKKGEEASLESFEQVFGSPLYPYTIDKARGLLLNIVAKKDLKLLEVNKILTSVASRIHKDARIIFGIGHEGAPEGAVKITVLATGCIYGDSAEAVKEVPLPDPRPQTVKVPVPPKPARTVPKPIPAAKKIVKPVIKLKKTVAIPNKIVKSKKKIEIKKETSENAKKVIFSALPKAAVVPPVMPGKAEIPVTSDDASVYQSQQSIAAQFETPIRRNALQVKKEIELEEKQMLEKEKEWDMPAFMRKQKK